MINIFKRFFLLFNFPFISSLIFMLLKHPLSEFEAFNLSKLDLLLDNLFSYLFRMHENIKVKMEYKIRIIYK